MTNMNDLIEETCPRCKGFVWHRREPCKCRPVNHKPLDRESLGMAIGGRIRACREAKGLSMEEVARRVPMSKTGLWQIETGGSEPRACTLRALAEVLEVSADYLLLLEDAD